MSDLISRKALLKDIKGMILCDIKTRDRVVDLIQRQPTAYDVDRVVDELKKNKVNCKNSGTIFDTWDYVKLEKAIETVKRGDGGE